jgi:hypothetical protein
VTLDSQLEPLLHLHLLLLWQRQRCVPLLAAVSSDS